MCEHLNAVKQAIVGAGMAITFSGQAWSKSSGEWTYFDCWLDLSKIRALFEFADCVVDHEHRGTHDGSESGLVCETCQDAVMGLHPSARAGRAVFPAIHH